jgi:hypothetical protein
MKFDLMVCVLCNLAFFFSDNQYLTHFYGLFKSKEGAQVR